MSRTYYEVSVPATVTVFVDGEGLTAEQAVEHAARYAESMKPSEMESEGYSSVAFAGNPAGIAITRADIDVTGRPSALDTTADRLVP